MHFLHPADPARLYFGLNWVQRTKVSIYEISGMLFLNMDIYFTYITKFNFAHFEFEESFGLIWIKLQNGQFHLQFSFRIFKGLSIQVWL